MRKKIAAGNWKMNLAHEDAIKLASDIKNGSMDDSVDVILAVPHVYLKSVADLVIEEKSIHIAAQNCHFKDKGAFTGEISIPMLKSIGIKNVIIGHSERRQLFNESDAFLKDKVDALLNHEMNPIFCCGEPLSIREENKQDLYVKEQLNNSLFHLESEHFKKLIIAYEPIWAIGTGKTASSDQAQSMHAFIRSLIADKYGNEVADSIPILYGGSVKPANAAELFGNKDVDGGLVGGASLSSESFLRIINAFPDH